ncbi:unnamed protein product [Prorocentrum cordatum]|uniref:Uncharacterized protein n=1 Tax=Prorocentrum cordatum TaxID=2364126 RepID=A0ABN9S5Q9_9DINO|nr:unnamed protein product [Polarella glacialis]
MASDDEMMWPTPVAEEACSVPKHGRTGNADLLREMLGDIRSNMATKDDVTEVKRNMHEHEGRIDGLTARMKAIEDRTNTSLDAAQSAAAAVMTEAVDNQLKDMKAHTLKMQAELAALSSRTPSTRSNASAASLEPEKERDNRKIWIAGFPRPLLAKVMSAHATQLIQKHVPNGITAMPKSHNFQTAYSIIFDSNEAAKDFLMRARTLGVRWRDPRTNIDCELKIRMDAPPAIRKVNRILGVLLSKVVETAKAYNKWSPSFTLGSQGFRGTLWLISNDDTENLFQVKGVESMQVDVIPNVVALKKIGFTDATINSTDNLVYMRNSHFREKSKSLILVVLRVWVFQSWWVVCTFGTFGKFYVLILLLFFVVYG